MGEKKKSGPQSHIIPFNNNADYSVNGMSTPTSSFSIPVLNSAT